MVQVPFVEVSHLAPSVSFFSAILQPLGLRYSDSTPGPPPSVTFGAAEGPVLRVRQTSEVPRLSKLLFTAPSRSAVLRFLDCGLKANPALRLEGLGQRQARGQRLGLIEDGGDGGFVRAAVLDLDGNRVEAVYPDPRPALGAMQQGGSAIHPARSGQGGASRILEWSYDVASSAPPPASHPSHSSTASQGAPRRVDTGDESHRRRPVSPPLRSAVPLQKPGGISTSTVVGALLGVAAGAALTYSMISPSGNDADQSRHQVDDARPLPRRTFTEQPKYHQEDHMMPATRKIGFAYPEHSGASASRLGYDHGRKSDRSDLRAQRYLVQGAQQLTTSQRADNKSTANSVPSSRARPMHQVRRGRSPEVVASARSRSEAPAERVRLPVAELDDRKSNRAPSVYRGPVAQPFHALSGSRTARSGYDAERSSYVATQARRFSVAPEQVRSRASQPVSMQQERTRPSRAGSIVSANRSAAVSAQLMAPGSSKTQSYVSARRIPLPASAAPSYMSARRVPLPSSRAPSYVSAREMPLPASDIGSSQANWNDMDSVAPSDSISCVGSRAENSRRSRRYH